MRRIVPADRMFTNLTIAFLLALSPGLWGQSVPMDRQAIVQGLRWHNDWQMQLPATDQFHCKGTRTEQYEFIYCEPGTVSMYFWLNPTAKSVSRSMVRRGVASYEQLLRAAPGTFGDWTGVVSDVMWDIGGEEVFQRGTRDQRLTQLFYDRSLAGSRLLAEGIAQALPADKFSILFPWVSVGDPEYHVYLAKAGKPYLVWTFLVVDSEIGEMRGFTYDVDHGNIPPVARRNLSELDRWYRVIQIP